MSRFLASLMVFVLLTAVTATGQQNDPNHADPVDEVAASTLVHVGETAPPFTAELLGGGTFDLADHEGKVVLINWFATWCGPCKAEMPHLQTQVWERFEKDGLVMISVAREETAKEVAPFVEKYESTWPFALDPERKAFGKYATAYIPRNIVVDRKGKIVFQSQGFERHEFDEMITVIAGELGIPDARTSEPLSAHYEATGTAEARYAVTSISAFAECTASRGPYTTTLKMAPWGKLVLRQEAEGVSVSDVVLDGDLGWNNGEPIDDLGRWITRAHAFQWMVLEVEDWFSDLQPAGERDVARTSYSVWTGRDAMGGENQLFFAKDTGLLTMLEMPDHFTGEGRVTVTFEGWKTIDGVRFPNQVVGSVGDDRHELYFKEITLNDVDVAVFEGPKE